MKFKEFLALKTLAELGGQSMSDSLSQHTGLSKREIAQIMRNNYPIVFSDEKDTRNDAKLWRLADPEFWRTAVWSRVCRTKNGNIQGTLWLTVWR
jgi:hypothetical protein